MYTWKYVLAVIVLTLLTCVIFSGCTLVNVDSNAPDRHSVVGLKKTIGF
jgi:hypothetical protein